MISAMALALSLLSYRLSRKNMLNQEDATRPDVTASAKPLENNPGWIEVRLKVVNQMPSDLDASEVHLRWPLNAVGIGEYAAKTSSDVYGPKLPPVMPAETASRRFEIRQQIGPAGTARLPNNFNSAGREYITFYVRARRSVFAHSLRFSISFSLRKTDVRRFKRIVSKQRIMLPPKQRH